MVLDHMRRHSGVNCNITLCQIRCCLQSKDNTSSSTPSLKNPKKAVTVTAHSTTLLGFEELDQVSWILWRMCNVIGSLTQEALLPDYNQILLMTAWTFLSRSIEDCFLGSSSPRDL